MSNRSLPLLVLLLAWDWHMELQHMLEKCYRSGGLSSVERDPCRLRCESLNGHTLWVRSMSERVCQGLP